MLWKQSYIFRKHRITYGEALPFEMILSLSSSKPCSAIQVSACALVLLSFNDDDNDENGKESL
jgi:hypothetical protein